MGGYGGQGPLLMGITWTETIIGTICVAARIYTAARYTKRVEWNLLWIVLTAAIALAAQISLTIAASFGIGNHIAKLTPRQVVQSQKWSWVDQILIIQGIGLGKVAVVALLLQIQGKAHKKKKIVLYIVSYGMVAINIVQLALLLVACSPYYKLWDMAAPGNCNLLSVAIGYGYLQASWAIASDVTLSIYPIFIFWSLNVPMRRKVGLCLLMGGGLIAAVAGIIKTVYINEVFNADDHTFALVPLLAAGVSEQWLVIILGSLPPLRVLYNLTKASRKGTFQIESYSGSEERKDSHGKVPDPYTLGSMAYAESTAPTTHTESQPIGPSSLRNEINITTNCEVVYEEHGLPVAEVERSLCSLPGRSDRLTELKSEKS